jgi:hypothetical protein
MNELQGRQPTGQWVDPSSRWRDIQSAILQPEDTQKLTLEEMRQMKDLLKELNSNGLRIRG